jgi:hypothetical protein
MKSGFSTQDFEIPILGRNIFTRQAPPLTAFPVGMAHRTPRSQRSAARKTTQSVAEGIPTGTVGTRSGPLQVLGLREDWSGCDAGEIRSSDQSTAQVEVAIVHDCILATMGLEILARAIVPRRPGRIPRSLPGNTEGHGAEFR